jgi:hypothetical protein
VPAAGSGYGEKPGENPAFRMKDTMPVKRGETPPA